MGALKPEIGPRRQHPGSFVHDLGMGQVAVGEHHNVRLVVPDQVGQLLLGTDGDAFGVQLAGQGGGIHFSFDSGNLRGSEGDDVVMVVVAEEDVEVVKIPPRRPHDDDFLFHPSAPGFNMSFPRFSGLRPAFRTPWNTGPIVSSRSAGPNFFTKEKNHSRGKDITTAPITSFSLKSRLGLLGWLLWQETQE